MKRIVFIVVIFLSLLMGCTKYTAKPGDNSSSNSGSSGSGSSGTGSGSSGSGTGTGSGSSGSSSSSTSGSSGPTSDPIRIVYTATSPCAPSNEVFSFSCTGSSIPSNAQYEWYFGDGNNSKQATPSNIYYYPGFYTVLVKIKTSAGEDVGQKTMVVTSVGQGVTPVSSFYSQQNTQTPSVYTFNSTSSLQTGNIVAYTWDFGDGKTGSGSFVTHDFATKNVDQTFNVKLSVKSDGGCTTSRINQVTVPAVYNITGGITATSTSPCAPSKEVFTFTAPTTNVPSGATYNWDFGDGSVATGNPVTKEFSFTNTYDVKLIIKYNGMEIYRTTKSVSTKGQNVTPSAGFIIQATNSTGNAYNFNSTSTVASGASITNFAWDFGDGTTGTNINVDHTYTRQSTDKTYTVKLTVTANSGCSATTTNTVNVPKQ